MRKLLTSLSLFMLLCVTVFAQEIAANNIVSVVVSPADTVLDVGGNLTFTAAAYDSSNNVIETTFTWSIESDTEIGTINNGAFTASAVGSGFIVASADSADTTIVDKASITVNALPVEPSITIFPDSAAVAVNDTIQFEAQVEGIEGDVVWAVLDDEIGEIDSLGLFTAKAVGTTKVTASIGDVMDEADVTVNAIPVEPSIKISPDSAAVVINDTVQFEAQVEGIEGDVVWAVLDDQIGEIDSLGLFTAKAVGTTKVTATIGEVMDEADVTVLAEEPPLPEGVNIVKIQRQNSDGKITKFGSSIAEGDTVTIGGIPYPFNYMNGMKLFFPENSLNDDIIITIKIPEKIVKVNNPKTEVTFEGNIVNAVTFNVSVAGIEQHPYVFAAPIEVSLPYKKGLLDKLGIEPENLEMFYIDAEGNLLSEGITNVALDSLTNRITGTVAHFSDIVLAPGNANTIAEESSQPSEFALLNNYPNPFNPETTISYSLTKSSLVTISIYNIVGQRVRTLVESVRPAGTYSIKWDGKNNVGEKVTSGLYLCRMEAGNFSQTRKLMLMK